MKKFSVVVLLVLAVSGLASADVQPSDEMLYYNMSNGFTDLSDNNRDGVGQGGISSGSATGVFGGATSFDGSSEYVEVPDLPESKISNMSVSLWYYKTTTEHIDEYSSHAIFTSGYDSSANNEPYSLQFQSKGSTAELTTITWKRYDGSQNGIVQEPYNFDVNNWHHLVAQYDSTGNEWIIYRDGEEIVSSSSTTGIGGVNEVVDGLGASYDDTQWERFFDGRIDEFRVYNDILSQSQIDSLYENNTISTTDTSNGETTTGNNLYKKIDVTDQSGSSIPSMQLELNISYDSDMQNDFSDLRFYESKDKQTELDYYLVDKQDSSWARVFVDVSDIPASGTKSVHMFYGNSSLSSASDGSSTFPFFDGGEDGSMSEYSQDSQASTSWGAVQSNLFKGDYVFEDESADDNEVFWDEVDSLTGRDVLFGGFTEQRDNTNTRIMLGNTSGTPYESSNIGSTTPSFVSVMLHESENVYSCADDSNSFGSFDLGSHDFQYMVDISEKKFDFELDNKDYGVDQDFCKDTSNNLDNGVRFLISSLYTDQSSIDSIYIGEYRLPEPTTSFSSEKSISTFNLDIENPQEGETFSTSSVDLNGSVSKEANVSYSLDGGSEQTICNNCTSFSTSLTGLSEGSHQAEVTAVKYDNTSQNETVLKNFTVNFPPQYRNLNQEFNSILPTESNNISVEGYDGTGLSQAFLLTNSSGSWTKYNSVNNFKENSGNEWFASNGESQPAHDAIHPQGEYVSKKNRTYIVWQGADLDPYIKYFDHDSRSWSSSVEIGDNPLSTDDHGAPSIVIDDSGYLHVFFGSHNTQQQYYRSGNPYDIDSWTDKSTALDASRATYPIPFEGDEKIYLAYRYEIDSNTKPLVMKSSSDNGDTWSSRNTLVDFSDGSNFWMYPGNFEYRDGKIHFSFLEDLNNGIQTDDRRSIFYAVYNTSDEEIYSISGENYGSTLSESEAFSGDVLVWDPGDSNTIVPRFAWHEKGGYPVVQWSELIGSSDYWKHRWSKWDGDSWTSPENITQSEYDNCCTIGTVLADNGSVEAYLPEDFGTASNRGGNITKWEFDGTGFEKTELIASTEDYKSMNAPSKITNFRDSFKIMFSEVDEADYSNSDLKVFGWGEKDIFGSPESFGGVSDSWELADFVYNDAGYVDRTVGWNIQFEDTAGNTNTTALNTFTVGDYQTQDTTPPTSSDNWSASGFVDKSSVDVMISTTDSGSGVANITYSINGGTETTVSGSSTTVTISDPGNNSLSYYATDKDGNVEASNTEYVTLDAEKPLVEFNPSTTEGEIDQDFITVNVSASDSVSGLSSVTENFNGTKTSLTKNAEGYYISNHTGLSEGLYEFNVTAEDLAGNQNTTVTKSATVNLTNRPSAGLVLNASVVEIGEVFQADGSCSDSDGTCESIEYDWDGDGVYEASGDTAVHGYGSPGEKTVSVRVTDNEGLTDTASENITVDTNDAPSASFTASTSDLGVSVDASGSSDVDGSIVSYSWDWTNDGSFEANGETASHSYSSGGDYTVKLKIEDDDEATDTATKTVSVSSSDDGDDGGGGGGGDTSNPPTVSISKPNGTVFGLENIDLNYSVSDADTCEYTVNNGQRKNLTNCGNTEFNVSGIGDHQVTVYASNSDGERFEVREFETDLRNEIRLNSSKTGAVENFSIDFAGLESDTDNGVIQFNTSQLSTGNNTLELLSEGFVTEKEIFDVDGSFQINKTYTVTPYNITFKAFDESNPSKQFNSVNLSVLKGTDIQNVQETNNQGGFASIDDSNGNFDVDLNKSMKNTSVLHESLEFRVFDENTQQGAAGPEYSMKVQLNYRDGEKVNHTIFSNYDVPNGYEQTESISINKTAKVERAIVYGKNGESNPRDQPSVEDFTFVDDSFQNSAELDDTYNVWKRKGFPTGSINLEVTKTGFKTRNYKTEFSGKSNSDVKAFLLENSKGVFVETEAIGSSGNLLPDTQFTLKRVLGNELETLSQLNASTQGSAAFFTNPDSRYTLEATHPEFKDGSAVFSPSNYRTDPLRITLAETLEETTLDVAPLFSGNCSANTTTIECSYDGQVKKMDKAILDVEEYGVAVNETICRQENTSTEGTLTCTGLNTSEKRYKFLLTGKYGSAITQADAGVLGTKDSPVPLTGLFMTAIIFMIVTSATAFDLRIGIGAGTTTLILANMIDWITLTPTQNATLIAVAIIAGVAVQKK